MTVRIPAAADGVPRGWLIEYARRPTGETTIRRSERLRGADALARGLRRMVRRNTSMIDLHIDGRPARDGAKVATWTDGVRVYYRGHLRRREHSAQEWARAPQHHRQPGLSWRLENVDRQRYPAKPILAAEGVLGLALHAAGHRNHPLARAPQPRDTPPDGV